MSLRLEMLQVARLAPQVLGDSSGLVLEYLLGRQTREGGFPDRTGKADLYYTVFGIEGLLALSGKGVASQPLDALESYLRSFGCGAGMDLVHLSCLIRAWAGLRHLQSGASGAADLVHRGAWADRIAALASHDGGWGPAAGAQHGSAYGCFLALGAYQDLALACPNPQGIITCLDRLKTVDGAWGNEMGPKEGSTNATAAAVAVLRSLQGPIPSSAGAWLLNQAHPQGGFRAMPKAPLPDLLSTATALHALAGLQIPIAALKDACLDFVDSLWTNQGGFHGHWADDELDAEYTYYGLLALGHLSLA